MLAVTNAFGSRIGRTAPHLLVPKISCYPTHSRFLAKQRSSALPQLSKWQSSGNHQLLPNVTTKMTFGWIRRVGVHSKVTATASIPSTEDKLTNTKPEKPFRRLLSLAYPERWVISASVACLCVSSAVTMSVPYCIGKILDIIFTDSFIAENLSTFCLGMIGVFVVGSAANFGRIYLMNGACEYSIYNNQLQYFNRFISFYEKHFESFELCARNCFTK